MSKQNDVRYLSWAQYSYLLSQGKIKIQHQKTAQEIETEKLIQRCADAVARGDRFC
jgi:hypothetical protein